MARRFILSDDLTGNEEESVKTLVFMVQGQNYEIDLSDASRKAFDKALKRFIDKGRKITALRARSLATEETSDAEETANIRAWAKQQPENDEWQVGDKGRISADVREAFQKAHSETSEDDSDSEGNDDNADSDSE